MVGGGCGEKGIPIDRHIPGRTGLRTMGGLCGREEQVYREREIYIRPDICIVEIAG